MKRPSYLKLALPLIPIGLLAASLPIALDMSTLPAGTVGSSLLLACILLVLLGVGIVTIVHRSKVTKVFIVIVYLLAVFATLIDIVILAGWTAAANGALCTGFFGVQEDCVTYAAFLAALVTINPLSMGVVALLVLGALLAQMKGGTTR